MAHFLIENSFKNKAKAFADNISQLKEIQLRRLGDLLKANAACRYFSQLGLSANWSYQDFVNNIPVSNYDDYAESLEVQRKENLPILSRDCQRYQPTSGSTGKRKWIPYSDQLKDEFDQALAPWLYDLYQQFPTLKHGQHYWSLSWLPTQMRQDKSSTNDAELFGAFQKRLLQNTLAVPNELAYTTTSHAAQIATLAYLLACPDLRLISVWSPTFALGLFDLLLEQKKYLSELLSNGDWGKLQLEMNGLKCPKNLAQAKKLDAFDLSHPLKLHQIWPKMGLISAWDTSSSKSWAEKLKELFPQSIFQGKGLFTTEAVVSFPWRGENVLAYQSHFYEFLCHETQNIHPAWELQTGMTVSPIVSTGSGFMRYLIKDLVLIKGFHHGLPILEFLGRKQEIDFVGEKMAPEQVQKLFEALEKKFTTVQGISLFGVEDTQARPYYLAIVKAPTTTETIHQEISQFLEKELREYFHYNLARDLGQLRPLVLHLSDRPEKLMQKIACNKGLVEGDAKMEVLSKVKPQQLEGLL